MSTISLRNKWIKADLVYFNGAMQRDIVFHCDDNGKISKIGANLSIDGEVVELKGKVQSFVLRQRLQRLFTGNSPRSH